VLGSFTLFLSEIQAPKTDLGTIQLIFCSGYKKFQYFGSLTEISGVRASGHRLEDSPPASEANGSLPANGDRLRRCFRKLAASPRLSISPSSISVTRANGEGRGEAKEDLLQHKQIAVVVPAYNEERLLPRTIASIPDFIDQVIVVDDASLDATSQSAQQSKRPNLTVVRHTKNKGVGAAIVTGYKIALQQKADIVVVMAADAQMDPADLKPLLTPILEDRADYAKGNRLSHPAVFRVMPWKRLVGSYILSLLTRPLSGYWSLLDSQCGYTAIHKRALERLALDDLYPRYGYPNDLLIQLGARGLRAVDVVVRPVYGDETSGFRPLTVAPKIMYVLARALVKRLAYHLNESK
jgi:hypothetical protein